MLQSIPSHRVFVAIIFISLGHISLFPAVQTEPTPHDCGRHDDVISALHALGYSARALPGGRLAALDGDVALHPEELLSSTERAGGVASGRPWRDPPGRPLLQYRLYSGSRLAVGALSAALSSWTAQTCLQAVRLPDGDCSPDADCSPGGDCSPDADCGASPVLCVGNFTGCWSFVGAPRSGHAAASAAAQFLSLEPVRCGPVTAMHQLGHALGLQHQHQRPDRHHWLHLHPEHSPVHQLTELGGRRQATLCRSERLAAPTPPAPYDPLSVMQLRSAAFADEDQRPVLVAREGSRQYLLDYGVLSGRRPSHLDLYTVSTVYSCQSARRRTCVAVDRPAPRCHNMGYLSVNCRCICSSEYSGPTCRTPAAASPSPPHVLLMQVNTSQTVRLADRGLSAEPVPGAPAYFQYVQFITVTAAALSDSHRVSIGLQLRPDVLLPLASRPNLITSLVANLANEHELLLLLWRSWPSSGGLRAECLSSVAGLEVTSPVLRGRSRHLHLTIISALGRLLRDPRETVLFLTGLELEVEFIPRPDSALTVRGEAPAASTPAPEDTGAVTEATAEAEASTEDAAGAAAAERLAMAYGRRLEPGEKLVVAIGGITVALLAALLCFVFANFLCGENRRTEQRR